LPRVFAPVFICLTLTAALLVASVWTGAPARGPRFRPSRLLADTFREVLCRLPSDAETVEWDSRPFDRPTLVQALEATEESGRVQQVRGLYFEVLRRSATSKDCAQIRQLIDRRLDLDAAGREIMRLPEARRIDGVRQLFIEVFGRDPRGWDDPGLRRWVDSPFGLTEIRNHLREQRPLVGIHYFAWYRPDPAGWSNDVTRMPADSPKPWLGWYDSGDTDVITTQIRQIEDAGFDFVAVHVIPALPRTWRNAGTFFGSLSGHRLQAALVLDGLYDASPSTKAMWVEMAKAEFVTNTHYLRLHGEPLVMLFSTRLDFDAPGFVLRNVYWSYRYDPGGNPFNGNGALESRDWPFWAPTPQPLANGMVPVIPGYTDVELGRSRPMLHPRNNGQMYREQWQRALALHPEVILVYSWNEYFERTAIEPTDAWGDQYLRMSTCFIEAAHRGRVADC
jgi:hypothetical protein